MVLKGCSAGGLAVYLHCDLFADMLKAAGSSARVVCMPDAGFFRMDIPTYNGVPHYTPEQQWVYAYQGVTQMDAGCVAAHAASNDTWRCFFAEAQLPYITSPLFVTQDTVDSWQMVNILALPCNPGLPPSNPKGCNDTYIAVMDDFHASMLAAYAPLLNSPTNGGFLSTCYQHCHQNIDGVWAQEVVANLTVQEAFFGWWSGAPGVPRFAVDGLWRSNPHCYGSPYDAPCSMLPLPAP